MADLIKLAVNLEDMKEYEPLPAGPYPAELRDIELRHSEKQPHGYLYCTFRIDPADFPADYDVENAPEGLNIVFARAQLPDPANRRTVAPFKAFLKALGKEAIGAEFNPDEWVGIQVQLLLSKNEYNGQMVNNCEAVQKLPGV